VNKTNSHSAGPRVLTGMGWPIGIGLALCSLFYVAVHRGPLNYPSMLRYFASHPASYAETALFLIGLSALLRKILDVSLESASLEVMPIESAPSEGQHVQEAQTMLDSLEAAETTVPETYLRRRVRDALRFVARRHSAEGLEEELKFLAEREARDQHASYSLVRILVWAIPILGLLGTMMGIAHALGTSDFVAFAASHSKTATQGFSKALFFAFDPICLAIAMSLILTFIQFALERAEVEMLSNVNRNADQLMIGRFQQVGGNLDPHLASIERMCYAVMRGVEKLVDRQSELWRSTVDSAQQQWQETWKTSAEALHITLTQSLDNSLTSHAERLSLLENEATASAQERWHTWQQVLEQNASLLRDQQASVQRQGDLLARIVEGTNEVMQLERALNNNLKTLMTANNFEDTVISLAASIQLLSSRLAPAGDLRKIDLRINAPHTEHRVA